MPEKDNFRVLTASENGPFIVGLVAVGYGGDVATMQVLHQNNDEIQAKIYKLQAADHSLRTELSPAAIAKDQHTIQAETKHLSSAPNVFEDIGICTAIPLLGAAALTAASSSIRYWHHKRCARP